MVNIKTGKETGKKEEFDKELVFNNIEYLIKESNKKIGEVEKEAGVSTGYISRCSKEDGPKPSIDFIVSVAAQLDVTVDALLNDKFGDMNPTEAYVYKFIQKLIRDTQEDKLEWIKESAEHLNRMEDNEEGKCEHPLLSYVEYTVEMDESYEYREGWRFKSHSFENHTCISGDCFHVKLKNGALIYYMDIEKDDHRLVDRSAYAREIWMVTPSGEKQFLSYNRGAFKTPVERLWFTIVMKANRPKIKENIKEVIDAFMNDDI